MLKRAITGFVFVVLLLCASLLFKGILLIALFGVFALIGTWEYYQMLFKNSEVIPHRFYGLFLNALVYLYMTVFNGFNFWFLFPFLFVPFFTELFRKNSAPFTNLLHVIAPVLYITLPMALFVKLGFPHQDNRYEYYLILTFLFLQWGNDTGAYLSGRFFGKRKLFERISPNKTWEGAVGGAVLTLILAWVCFLNYQTYPLYFYLGIALTIAIVGSIGDLVQSMLKRSLNVKDSGKIMPGHGGVLDRFDGLILAAPFIFAWKEFYFEVLSSI